MVFRFPTFLLHK